MGKDKEKTPKKPATRVRSFRLTQSESDLIDKLAAEYDVTPSHVMRLVIVIWAVPLLHLPIIWMQNT